MAWWAWLIIWTVLVLGLLGMLALLGYRLFTKARGALRELEQLTEKVARLSENVEQLQPEPVENAIALGYPEVARRRDVLTSRRDELKQARREARLAHGKLLISPVRIPTPRKQPNNAR
ncbi:MAG: hypothetical protein Q7T71_11040 [Herbiconiux sp.]|nr:hypothetical protein [Herbiconiux sp.]